MTSASFSINKPPLAARRGAADTRNMSTLGLAACEGVANGISSTPNGSNLEIAPEWRNSCQIPLDSFSSGNKCAN